MYYIQKNKETKINSENMHDGKGIIHRKPIFRDVSKLEVEIEEWEEVVDPAAGDQDVFDRCAEELEGLISRFAVKIL